MLAVCVSRAPGSVNVAATLTGEVSATVWSPPAFTSGATFTTCATTLAVPTPPSSSVTLTVRGKLPLSGYTCCSGIEMPPLASTVEGRVSTGVPSPQLMARVWVSAAPGSRKTTV